MKSPTLVFSCLMLHFDGVFGDSVQSVSAMEGESVTLNPDEIQSGDLPVWTFGADKTVIVNNFEVKIFKDRLLVDQQSAALTIKNITANFSGLYQFNNLRKDLYKTFNVTVYARLPVPVISRDCSSSSTSCSLLCSSVVKLSLANLSWYRGNRLLNTRGVSDLSISLSLPLEVEYQDKNTYICVLNNPISNQTQHLDITQLCSHTCTAAQGLPVGTIVGICVGVILAAGLAAGVCCYMRHVKKKDQTPEVIPLSNASRLVGGGEHETMLPLISQAANNTNACPEQPMNTSSNQESSSGPVHGYDDVDHPMNAQEEYDPLQEMFHTELDEIKKIKVKQGETITLKSAVTDIQKDDRLRWKYADPRVSDSTSLFTVIAIRKKMNNQYPTNDGPNWKFKDRLTLDHKTGNLTIKNMRFKDSGYFKLEIYGSTNRRTKTIKVNVCDSTKMGGNDVNETTFSLIPEEDPNDTSTYTVEPMNTSSNEEESGGER